MFYLIVKFQNGILKLICIYIRSIEKNVYTFKSFYVHFSFFDKAKSQRIRIKIL